jgi:ATP-dependent protease ClpP protease subunit
MTEFYNLETSSDGNTLNISINDDIGSYWGATADDLAYLLSKSPDVKDIEVDINSDGGSVFQGTSIYNQLKNHPAKVTTRVTGLAASAASYVFLAGDVRIMNTGSFLMIHKPMAGAIADADELRDKPMAGAIADADELRDIAENLDKIQEGIIDIYEEETNLDREALSEMVNAETWIGQTEGLEMGFATEISEEEATVTNKYDFVEYTNKFNSDIPKEAEKFFKNRSAIQRLWNKITNKKNDNSNKEVEMKPEEVKNLLDEKVGEVKADFENQLKEVKAASNEQITNLTNKLDAKDEVINNLNTKITDLTNQASKNTLEKVVDGFINEGKILPKDKNNEINNLKLREGTDDYDNYLNSIKSRVPAVNFTRNIANKGNGVPRNTNSSLSDLINKKLEEKGKTLKNASRDEIKEASSEARKEMQGA